MADEITQKHLDRLRVRGAPAAIVGATGMVGTYDFSEKTRQTVRALSMDLGESFHDGEFNVTPLREGSAKLAQLAATQNLRVLEQPVFALNGDPVADPPHEWTWELLLPVRGPAKHDEEAGVSVSRIHGGAYLETMTTKGFGDLFNLHTYFLGRLLPQRKQQLARSVIYHRVVDGFESDDPTKLSLAVYIPYYLSLKKPPEMFTRNTMA